MEPLKILIEVLRIRERRDNVISEMSLPKGLNAIFLVMCLLELT